MAKQRTILLLVVCVLVAVFAVQALSDARSSNRTTRASAPERRRRMTDAERRKEAAETRRQRELKNRELTKEGRGPLIDRKQRTKELREKAAERRKDFLREKSALGATEEQWKLIKAKLEKVRLLRDRVDSRVGVSLGTVKSGGVGARMSVPAFQWERPWKDKVPSELTEAQRLAKQLIALVERRNTTPQAFRRKMAALRKARSEQEQLNRQLADARRELCEMLTTRQEAALVLMSRL